MDSKELTYAIALTKLKSLNLTELKHLFDSAGSATAIIENSKDIRTIVPDASKRLMRSLADTDDALKQAEVEMEYIQSKHINALTINDNDYPYRLRECADAPLVIYYVGNTDFNRKHVVSMVGTRKCTEYGRERCDAFIAELKDLLPDTLIISGLAYGIDICSHRAALANGLDTIGVVAHGLDTVYPTMHRQTAVEMVRNGGGMLTEYTHGTAIAKMNFVRRNRIVAGMSDACLVVESAIKGGSLITARIASDYNRDVFAFPGKVGDEQSAGCNKIIRQQEAHLITSASDLVETMGWGDDCIVTAPAAIQQELFPQLTKDEQAIIEALKQSEEAHINMLSNSTGINFSTVSSVLFELEMKGIVKSLGGARYKLVRKGL